jgi:hypothetical protein
VVISIQEATAQSSGNPWLNVHDESLAIQRPKSDICGIEKCGIVGFCRSDGAKQAVKFGFCASPSGLFRIEILSYIEDRSHYFSMEIDG